MKHDVNNKIHAKEKYKQLIKKSRRNMKVK